jgi:pimeloyl-ACP methyl ester carboxylesterase
MKQPKWLNTSEYPFQSYYYAVGEHQLHYIDEGVGDTILFVHGTPSWSFDFRNVIKKLRPKYRCIALDHMGFGLSDKPEKYFYTLQSHIQNLEALVKHLQLRDITLVVHDFGGPIGLAFAEQHPDLIKRIVVLNSWLWSIEEEPEFKKMRRILKSPLLPFLYRYFNFSARFLLPASFGEHKPDKAILRHFTSPFANKSQRNGTVGFAHSLLNDQPFFEKLWQEKKSISEKPALFIWGMKDAFVGEKYLNKFITGFSNSQCLKIASAGHFPQEEAPNEVAESIRNFMQGN